MMELNIDGVSLPESETINQMKLAAAYCLEAEGIDHENIEVSLTFVDSDEINELNSAYRGVDAVTDVLSFPQFESPGEIPQTGFVLLGDVVICLDQALAQAEAYGHTPEREILFLFVHSMYHLLGYDHHCDEEQAVMRQAEETVLARLGLERS
jgi:probable rRNA maturation factor